MKEAEIEKLLEKVNASHPWDEMPVYCFTSDIDWASEDVMKVFFSVINELEIKPTLFVTHRSEIIEQNYTGKKIDRGIHPNFLRGSSHGSNFEEVAEFCVRLAPEAYGFRSHRAFDVTDITHLLRNQYGYKYVSNQITILHKFIRPILHESGLINFPVFFEDGTHLYNQMDLDYKKYESYFVTPGIKIISFHPMNFVLNSPTLSFMRQIKDSLTREEYNHINVETLVKLQNKNAGIRNTILDIINFVKEKNFPVYSMNELYNTIIKD